MNSLDEKLEVMRLLHDQNERGRLFSLFQASPDRYSCIIRDNTHSGCGGDASMKKAVDRAIEEFERDDLPTAAPARDILEDFDLG